MQFIARHQFLKQILTLKCPKVSIYAGRLGSHITLLQYYSLSLKHFSSTSQEKRQFKTGRRNIRESDYDAAKREFMEETGVKESEFIILSNVPTLIEEYTGSDNIQYKHRPTPTKIGLF